jgi:single-strand DNA-binding protein
MGFLNRVMLIGNLGRDPEIRYTKEGVPVATFTIATNEYFRDKSGEKVVKTEWHRVVAWRKLAEWVVQFLSKGKQVYVEGKIRTREYDDKSGIKRRVTEIVALRIQLLGVPPSTDTISEETEEPPPEAIESEDVPF